MSKNASWNNVQKKVDRIVDGLGKHVDKSIKETVIALLVLDFSTSASCQGHLGKHGLPYPWIDITVPTPEGWREDDAKKTQISKELLHQERRIINYLEEFYAGRNTKYEAILVPVRRGYRLRLCSIGTAISETLSLNQKRRKYGIYKKEMTDFAEFLKAKFFSE